jgi:hypothetical protein
MHGSAVSTARYWPFVVCLECCVPTGHATAAAPEDARPVAAALQDSPSVSLDNARIAMSVALPDATRGFYRGTRFDWSGMVTSLCSGGQRFYGPWFERISPSVRDFSYDGDAVVASTMSNATGPAEEFDPIDSPPGFDRAKPGDSFIKIGVGVLRRPDSSGYDHYHTYDILDSGHWSSRRTGSNRLVLIQEVTDPRSGYAYRYTKRLELVPGAPRMIISHTLENRGTMAIHSTVYDHNFLTLDGHPTQAGLAVEVPFPIRSDATAADAAIAGGRATLARAPDTQGSIHFSIAGFGPGAGDYRVTVASADQRAAVTVTGDRPLDKFSLWSIRSVVAVEPFIRVDVAAHDTFRWRYVYDYRAGSGAAVPCPN